MDSSDFNSAIVKMSSAFMQQQAVNKILECNKEIVKHGLYLNSQQALDLFRTRTNALKESKRIELNGGIIDKLVLAFCDSPYVDKNTYEDTLHVLINLFYDLKNNTWDIVSDSDVIEFMKNAFNNRCHGSIELLSDEAFKLSEHIRSGKNIDTFKEV